MWVADWRTARVWLHLFSKFNKYRVFCDVRLINEIYFEKEAARQIPLNIMWIFFSMTLSKKFTISFLKIKNYLLVKVFKRFCQVMLEFCIFQEFSWTFLNISRTKKRPIVFTEVISLVIRNHYDCNQ